MELSRLYPASVRHTEASSTRLTRVGRCDRRAQRSWSLELGLEGRCPMTAHKGVSLSWRHFKAAGSPSGDSILPGDAPECAGTHFLVAGSPAVAARCARPTAGAVLQPHACLVQPQRRGGLGGCSGRRARYLLRKEPVPGSLRKTFGERRNLLSDGERVPRSGEVADIFVLLALVTGQCLLPDVWVRCRDKSSSGFHIGVAGFGSDGFGVRNYWDGQRRGYLGLASPRRF